MVRTGVTELETVKALHARILSRIASGKADLEGGSGAAGADAGAEAAVPLPRSSSRSQLGPVAEDSPAFADSEADTAALALSVASPQLQAIPVRA